MKHFGVLLICLQFHVFIFCQTGMWTFLKGGVFDSNLGANYGTQGVAADSVRPPVLYEPAQWTDLQGNFWLFGGRSTVFYDVNNNLWKYNPATNQWTWVKGPGHYGDFGHYGTLGVPSSANNPPCRGWGVATWTDLNGDLWLYGGGGFDSVTFLGTMYADLWRYNIASNTWTWMNGTGAVNVLQNNGVQGVPSSLSQPGSRDETAATWVDANNYLWFFGGRKYGTPIRNSNELWRYNVTTNQWTWMKGGTFGTLNGIYGTKGVANNLNTPAAKAAYCAWTGNDGTFWLFGGGFMGNPAHDYNDMWRYEPATNYWTWMSGTNITDDSIGNYGPLCSVSVNYLPAARSENRACWKDRYGNFLFYGGFKDSKIDSNYSDLWSFNPATLTWARLNGDDSLRRPPVYGTMGVPAPANTPGGRLGSASWTGNTGELFLFGGQSNDGHYNDLWKFVIDSACSTGCTTELLNLGNDTTYCANFSRTLNTNGYVAEWSTGDVGQLITVANPGIYWAKYNLACGTVSDTIVLNQQTAPPGFYLGSDTMYCGLFSRILNTGISNTYWSTGAIASQITVTSLGTYWASVANACGATSDTITFSSSFSPNINLGNDTTICAGDSVYLCAPGGYTSYNWNNGKNTPCIYASIDGNYIVTVTDINGCTAESNHPVLTIHQLPNAFITVSNDTLYATSAASYQWYLNGVAINGATEQKYIYNQPGSYTVAEFDSIGCKANSNTITITLTDISNLRNSEIVITITPNPATTSVTITISEDMLNSTATITDIAGRDVTPLSFGKGMGVRSAVQLNTYNSTLNTSAFSNGVYFITLTTPEGRTATKKLVISK